MAISFDDDRGFSSRGKFHFQTGAGLLNTHLSPIAKPGRGSIKVCAEETVGPTCLVSGGWPRVFSPSFSQEGRGLYITNPAGQGARFRFSDFISAPSHAFRFGETERRAPFLRQRDARRDIRSDATRSAPMRSAANPK